MKMKRETLKKILNFVITVLTAVASAFVCRAASSINPLKIQHYENTRKISLIVIHCSATRVTQDFTFEKLEACHLARGFRSIGYHYYITKDGVIYPGRPESEIGAHARHFNAHSIGICYEGGLDADGNPADTRTKAQKQSLQNLLTSLCVDYPEAEILGHRDLPNVHKSCPCFSVQAWLNEIKFNI